MNEYRVFVGHHLQSIRQGIPQLIRVVSLPMIVWEASLIISQAAYMMRIDTDPGDSPHCGISIDS